MSRKEALNALLNALDREEEKMSIYTQQGYGSRADYLKQLADDYGVEEQVVFQLAALLGPNEDFDGLVSEVDDYAMKQEYSR